MSGKAQTLYAIAKRAMQNEIKRYLRLAGVTDGFTSPLSPKIKLNKKEAFLLSIGFGTAPDAKPLTKKQLNLEMVRKPAVPFNVEAAVTYGVYDQVRPYAKKLYIDAETLTDKWRSFDEDAIHANAHLLPIFQHVGKVFSKAELKKEIGSVSDNSISKRAAKRLSVLLQKRTIPHKIKREQVLTRLEATLEGIVRDLVGKVLLEEVVAHALRAQDVPFLRESEYPALSGVIYDFRADFIIPNHVSPVAFIEVRKSSSRHASLYAKDKMFSAINWKGKHPKLIGVIVAEGDWTGATLRVMAKIFDYVVPLTRVNELAKTLRKAVDGDQTVLKWLVKFQIKEAPDFNGD